MVNGSFRYEVLDTSHTLFAEDFVAAVFSGTFVGETTLSGSYSVSLCGNTLVSSAVEGQWTASWQQASATKPTPEVAPAVEKVGHSGRPAAVVAVQGDYAYIGERKEVLTVLDVTDPTNPKVVGMSAPLRGENASPLNTFEDLAVLGDYVYIAAGELYVMDVSNPAVPVKVAIYDAFTSAFGVYVSGRNAYVAAGGLQILDVSEPTLPVWVGGLDTPPGRGRNVFVNGNYAYLANQGDLRVIDVSNPAAPTEVGVYETSGSVDDVFVTDEYAVIVGSDGLQVLDVSDPTAPVQLGTYPGYLNSIYVADNNAYVDRLGGSWPAGREYVKPSCPSGSR